MRHRNNRLVARLMWLLVLLISISCYFGQQPRAVSWQDMTPDLVKLRITVSDNQGRLVTALNRDDFVLTVDKSPQQISYFEAKEEPASILLLIDVSGSMKTNNHRINRYDYLPRAIQEFLQIASPQSEFLLASFGRATQLVVDWTKNKTAIVNALANLGDPNVENKTVLYDACLFGLEQLKRAHNPKRVMILLSDGNNNSIGGVTEGRLKQEVRHDEGLVYAVNLGSLIFSREDVFRNQFGSIDGRGFLDSICKLAGGVAYHPTNVEGINLAFEAIAAELKFQYQIGIKLPQPAVANKFYKVEVKAASQAKAQYKLGRDSIRHREGFYAVPNQ